MARQENAAEVSFNPSTEALENVAPTSSSKRKAPTPLRQTRGRSRQAAVDGELDSTSLDTSAAAESSAGPGDGEDHADSSRDLANGSPVASKGKRSKRQPATSERGVGPSAMETAEDGVATAATSKSKRPIAGPDAEDAAPSKRAAGEAGSGGPAQSDAAQELARALMREREQYLRETAELRQQAFRREEEARQAQLAAQQARQAQQHLAKQLQELSAGVGAKRKGRDAAGAASTADASTGDSPADISQHKSPRKAAAGSGSASPTLAGGGPAAKRAAVGPAAGSADSSTASDINASKVASQSGTPGQAKGDSGHFFFFFLK